MSLRLGLGTIFIVTLWRIVMLHFDTTDLFVDEAQYWFWSQNLDFGYYSKPPMIAWVIRVITELSGSDSIFWIRIGGPLFHMATAIVLMRVARRFVGPDIEPWVGVTFITLPAVSLSSVLFSTDTVLFLFLAIALWAYFGLTERRSVVLALIMGISFGLGFMSKYAILFLVPGGLIALLLLPSARIAWRDFIISVLAAAVTVIPNLWWNLAHDITTVRHTQEIAHWSGLQLDVAGAAEFFFAQFGVVGPIIFYAMLWATYRMVRGRSEEKEKHLIWLSVPVVVLITLQALVAKAYANWGVTAYATGTILAVWLLHRKTKRGLSTSLIINSIAVILIPLATIFAHDLRLPNGDLVMKRYVGHSDLSRTIADVAKQANTNIIVADKREILADLFYTLRKEPYRIYARNLGGFPRSYYEQEFSLPAGVTDQVLYVSTEPFECPAHGVESVKDWQLTDGYMRGRHVYAYRMQPDCLKPAQ